MALARALAVEPQVLLLDEPFGALDAKVRKDLRTWLRRLHDEVHVTTIFVTHDQEEAMDVAEQLVVMNEGRVEQSRQRLRPLRAPGERVRDGLRRRGQPDRRPPRATHDMEVLERPAERTEEAMVERIVRSDSRSGSSSCSATAGDLGAADPGGDRGDRAARGPDRLRSPARDQGLQRRGRSHRRRLKGRGAGRSLPGGAPPRSRSSPRPGRTPRPAPAALRRRRRPASPSRGRRGC